MKCLENPTSVSRADICGHTDRHEEANRRFSQLMPTLPTIKSIDAFMHSYRWLAVREMAEDILISIESCFTILTQVLIMQHCPQNLFHDYSGLNKEERTEHLRMSFAASWRGEQLYQIEYYGWREVGLWVRYINEVASSQRKSK